MQKQIDLFDGILSAYQGGETLSNAQLYSKVVVACEIDANMLDERHPIGASGEMHSPMKRKIRWYQQTLKSLGLLERDENARGYWRLTPSGNVKCSKLTAADENRSLLGFSTDMGVALWSRCETAFPHLGESIDLVLSSLPYPLNVPRDYGNPKESEYVDWVCRILEPLIGQLVQGGSIVLNVGNDVFLKGSPARSMYKERMLLALNDRFDLQLMDTIIWDNPSRPPGPLRWASLSRQQLNATYEPMYWLCNDPLKSKANNRRVLQPHTDLHKKLMAQGGENRNTSYGDGAHQVRSGVSYSKQTEGKIPRNIISMGHRCAYKSEIAKLAKAIGLPVHGATMPLKLARFIIEFLTEENDLVVDPCAGWQTTARAAEDLKRRWFTTEQMGEYVLGGALGFRDSEGFEVNATFN